MALTLERTWQHAWNQVPTDNTTNQKLSQSFLQFFTQTLLGNTAMTDASGNPLTVTGKWTCAGSSDSSTAAMDGTNRLLAIANWVRASAGSAHSWIVLKSPTTGYGPAAVYILLDYSTANDGKVNVAFSKAGFTGGSITAAPTATDEYAITGNTTPQLWQFNDGTSATHTFHAALSTIGDPIILSSKVASGYFWAVFFGQFLAQAKAGDLYPWVFYHEYQASAPGVLQVGPFGGNSAWAAYHPDGTAVEQGCSVGVPYFAGGSVPLPQFLPTAGDIQDGSKPDAYCLIGTYKAASGATGTGSLRGRLADIKLFGLGANADVGKVTPVTGTPQGVVVGNVIVPSNSVPTL